MKHFKSENFALFASLAGLTLGLSNFACNRPLPPKIPVHIPSVQLELKKGQLLATQVAWREFERVSITPSGIPPIVIWYGPEKLDCPDKESFREYTEKGQECLYGIYYPVAHMAIVAWRGWRISETSFVHELCHAFFDDPNHELCHRTDAPGLVRDINLKLIELGL